jgi:DNA-binding PadR family transcriptional regulator
MAASEVEVVVLGLLAEGPVHGYDLIERARSRSMDLWAEVGKASIYQALHRLEARGLITGKAQEGSDGPDRRVYRVTGSGRRRLRAGLAERFGEPSPYATDGGLSLGFVHLLPAGDARRGLDGRERAVRDLLDAISTERARAAEDRTAGRVVADAMLDRQEALAKAELAWIKGFRATLGRLRR